MRRRRLFCSAGRGVKHHRCWWNSLKAPNKTHLSRNITSRNLAPLRCLIHMRVDIPNPDKEIIRSNTDQVWRPLPDIGAVIDDNDHGLFVWKQASE
jgi:hypothetical protein